MSGSIAQFVLWPTFVRVFDLAEMDDARNAQVRQAAINQVDLDVDIAQELRIHNFESTPVEGVQLLTGLIGEAIQNYCGQPAQSIGLRAVVLRHGKHICTHTESHESDLMVAYWPGGNPSDRGRPASIEPNRRDAPTFVLEDPSRHLTDLRLPGEDRHSICIKPRPGMLVIGPAHLPHNLHPYMGQEPFIHIVAQVRVRWPDNYGERW